MAEKEVLGYWKRAYRYAYRYCKDAYQSGDFASYAIEQYLITGKFFLKARYVDYMRNLIGNYRNKTYRERKNFSQPFEFKDAHKAIYQNNDFLLPLLKLTTKKKRAIIILHAVYGFTFLEIAFILGYSHEYVNTMYLKGLAEIKGSCKD